MNPQQYKCPTGSGQIVPKRASIEDTIVNVNANLEQLEKAVETLKLRLVAVLQPQELKDSVPSTPLPCNISPLHERLTNINRTVARLTNTLADICEQVEL